MIPIFGPPPRLGIRYRRRPGAYAILLDAGRILLTEQATDDGPDLQLPGGGIDPGEAPLPALAREVLEETGHTCRVLRRVGVFRQFNWMPEYRIHAEKVCAVYLCQPGLRPGPPTEAGHRAVWMTPDTAVARLPAPGSAAILRRVLSGAG
ncbi:NUDIX domain-containing protein [Jannaschia sp. KMU-145]|uniref:NUDIX domain-containing protein n=1 Tax=Jannaschia halovivens TaxID=3388667 RepID=UPI00396B3F6D